MADKQKGGGGTKSGAPASPADKQKSSDPKNVAPSSKGGPASGGKK